MTDLHDRFRQRLHDDLRDAITSNDPEAWPYYEYLTRCRNFCETREDEWDEYRAQLEQNVKAQWTREAKSQARHELEKAILKRLKESKLDALLEALGLDHIEALADHSDCY